MVAACIQKVFIDDEEEDDCRLVERSVSMYKSCSRRRSQGDRKKTEFGGGCYC